MQGWAHQTIVWVVGRMECLGFLVLGTPPGRVCVRVLAFLLEWSLSVICGWDGSCSWLFFPWLLVEGAWGWGCPNQ